MTVPKRSGEHRFSYRDYLTWPDDKRWEILAGVPFAMSPAPNPDHQRISRKLSTRIDQFLTGKLCEMFSAPIDLLLPEGNEADEDIETVLQPDILVVCDPLQITKRGIRGAPDFIIEIVSPTSASHDQVRKRRLYEKHGVQEYWVVDPRDRLVTVYRRGQGSPSPANAPRMTRNKGRAGSAPGGFADIQILDTTDLHLEVAVIAGLTIDFTEIFPPQPKVVKESPAAYL